MVLLHGIYLFLPQFRLLLSVIVSICIGRPDYTNALLQCLDLNHETRIGHPELVGLPLVLDETLLVILQLGLLADDVLVHVIDPLLKVHVLVFQHRHVFPVFLTFFTKFFLLGHHLIDLQHVLLQKLRHPQNMLLILLTLSELFLIDFSCLKEYFLGVINLLLNPASLNSQDFDNFIILNHRSQIILKCNRIINQNFISLQTISVGRRAPAIEFITSTVFLLPSLYLLGVHGYGEWDFEVLLVTHFEGYRFAAKMSSYFVSALSNMVRRLAETTLFLLFSRQGELLYVFYTLRLTQFFPELFKLLTFFIGQITITLRLGVIHCTLHGTRIRRLLLISSRHERFHIIFRFMCC